MVQKVRREVRRMREGNDASESYTQNLSVLIGQRNVSLLSDHDSAGLEPRNNCGGGKDCRRGPSYYRCLSVWLPSALGYRACEMPKGIIHEKQTS